MVLLVVGVRESARFNAVMVAIKLAAVLFFLAAGVTYVEPANWQPFAPYGWPGIMAAAAVVFFAYIGFDAVSTTAEEAKNPQRDLPIGIIASLVICTVLYLAVGLVLSGIVPVIQFRSAAEALPGVAMVDQAESIKFLNAPVAYALAFINQDWAAGLVSAGAVAGITSVLLVMLMSQPRIFFSMSRDRLLPQNVSKVHPKFGTPYITTIITCVIVALVAGLTQIQVVGEMTSIGTLFAFVVVCAAVLVLRAKRPDAKRPFRVPFGPVFPVLGILSCSYLMLSLPVLTWVRFLVWLDIGMIIYWTYGRTHSPLVNAAEAKARTPLQSLANFITTFGLLLIFNAACIAILGFFTELGITNETTAKWSEINRSRRRRGRRLRPAIPRRGHRGVGGRVWSHQGLRRKGIARRLDGVACAARVGEDVAPRITAFTARHGRPPGLAVVLAGTNPASEVYVRNKIKTVASAGCRADLFRLPESAGLDEALTLVRTLNADEAIDAILVQSPLPAGMGTDAEQRVFDAIDVAKDVDGFHPQNVGLLVQKRPALVACTPLGCIELLEREGIAMKGKHAVVIGRSDIVGKPMAMLLLHRDATVTTCHSRTTGLADIAKTADILVSAIGRPGLVTRDFIKPGATVIDVGINTLTSEDEVMRLFPEGSRQRAVFAEKGRVLVGDVHPNVDEVAGAVTPVPGGVGPMTVAMVLRNTVMAAELRATRKAAM